MFDTYISSFMSELESAKKDVEDYAVSLEEKVAVRTQQLSDLSSLDPLTSLYNQRSFYENMRRELAIAERNQYALALVYFDLNGFKKVNDTEGHICRPNNLMAVADVYDALTSTRPYKKSFTHEAAKVIIVEGRGKHFDPEVVDAFLALEDEFQEIYRTINDKTEC